MWEKWYAWHPVWTSSGRVWGEYVMRRRTRAGWEYRHMTKAESEEHERQMAW